ncbi:MAG: right-handed parallel beta-helix repeat-containing protein [Candidatus Bathyarchaeota archaeon]|nr:right-handed parallel beta-helix repeat-containing protein [Candidatus Termiticorpusculum sp.]
MQDGTVEGTNKISQNGNIYTLTEDLNSAVQDGSTFINIECDGIIFDGAGKTLKGTGGIAIGASGRHNITIKNTQVIDFGTGIELCDDIIYDSNGQAGIITPSGNRIVDNYFETKYWAISLRGVREFVSGNTFITKSDKAIEFWTNETTFIDNKFIDCGLFLMDDPSNGLNVISANTVNGKPLVFLEGQSNQVIDNADQVILINCTNMVIQNIDNLGLSQPVQLLGIINTTITNCKTHITLTNSNNNTITNNKITAAFITLTNSNNNTISNNELSAVKYSAVRLYDSSKNMITQNLIEGEYGGGIIICGNSEYNRVEKNTISYRSGGDTGSGIAVSGGKYNYIYENNITAENTGIGLDGIEYNVVFNNNVYQGKTSLSLFGSRYNDVFGNNFVDASGYAVHLLMSDYNNFFYNSFEGNTKVTEIHIDTLLNSTYYSEYNKWD